MKFFKKKAYKFTDDSIASDTIIAYVMGGLAIIFVTIAIISSFVTRGNIPRMVAVLPVCGIVMSATALFFAITGLKAPEGGVTGKRISIAFSVFSLILSLYFYIVGIL